MLAPPQGPDQPMELHLATKEPALVCDKAKGLPEIDTHIIHKLFSN
jgi:hypothetical protein